MKTEDVQALLAGLVAGGNSLAGAVRQLAPIVPSELLQRARVAYQDAVGGIVELKDPRVLVDDETGAWFAGPQPNHIFWPALRRQLEADLPLAAVEDVTKSASRVVGLLRAPGTPEIRTRGLVLGHVQSGKTTSFQSVAAMAADVGYRMVIVLSGITDNLRTQTQIRVDEQLIGENADKWFRLTDEFSDFHETRNAAVHMTASGKRLIAVVKKNPARLRRLANWIESAGEAAQLSCPILVIDDEADQASIDVGKRRRSTINDLIRRILKAPKSAYVAYTATPFANLLINPADVEGLYPRDFVVALKPGDGYYGPERLFGRDLLEHVEGEPAEPDDVIRLVDEAETPEVQPPRGVGGVHGWEPHVGQSLGDALDWFILATAARRGRGQSGAHSSMLIHTSMLADAHFKLQAVVEHHCASRLALLLADDDATVSALAALWERENGRVPSQPDELPVEWTAVLHHVVPVLESLKVIVDNYLSTDRLVYVKGEPLNCIAIGGNTLSRGLTLEGLVSSYFVRAASAYDTLLQMGRWFGYRRGYSDLVRIWMTQELAGWFRDLATVEAEIRAEIERYHLEQLKPSMLAVKIRTHPAMTITNAAKMKGAVTATLSYSGKREQTILFSHKDREQLERNWNVAGEFLQSAGAEPGVEIVRRAPAGGRHILRGVPAAHVVEFLQKFEFHPDSPRFRQDLLVKYIENERRNGGLLSWNVVVNGVQGGTKALLGGVGEVGLARRTQLKSSAPDVANIKALVGSRDRSFDLAPELVQQLPQRAMDHEIAKLRRDHGHGPLLSLYPLDKCAPVEGPAEKVKASERKSLEAEHHMIGVALFFPDAVGATELVEYVSADLGVVEDIDPDEALAAIDAADDERAREEEAQVGE